MDKYSAREINERVEKILTEISISDPPIDLETVLEFLNIHRSYYDLTNPSLLQEISHRLKVGSIKITGIFHKIKLRGLWLPDDKKILICKNVPKIKKRWICAHEIGHKIVPWHKDFIFGDITETLDPEYHELLESEANYAASTLLFLGTRFSREARDYPPTLNSVFKLSKVYGNSITMTLRRFVLFSTQEPMLGVVSKPYWEDNDGNLCKYFIASSKFSTMFPAIKPDFVLNQIQTYTAKKSGGPIGQSELTFLDANGEAHIFYSESFYNRYDILTLIVYRQKVFVSK